MTIDAITRTTLRVLLTLCVILARPVARGQNLDAPLPSTASFDGVRDLLARGESWEAVRVLRRRLAKSPEAGEIRLWLGVAYYLAGQYKLSAQEMTAAAEGLPLNPFPPYALGRYYLDIQQRADRAQSAFEETLRRSPNHSPALYHLGWCHELRGDTKKAAELYRRASGYWLAHAGLARLALRRGDPEEAVPQARRAVLLKPDAAMARLVYGQALERAGEVEPALEQFEQAASLDPTDASGLYQALRCARRLKQEGKVRDLLDRYKAVTATYGPGQ